MADKDRVKEFVGINKTGFLTVDEERRAADYEPLPDGKGDIIVAEETLTNLVGDFIEVTSVGDPLGQKRFKNVLTGRTLIVSAKWEEVL